MVVESTFTVPSVVAASLNVTVPPACPPKADAIVAVKPTDLPAVDGLSEEVSVVVVDAFLTISVKAAEALPIRLAPPL